MPRPALSCTAISKESCLCCMVAGLSAGLLSARGGGSKAALAPWWTGGVQLTQCPCCQCHTAAARSGQLHSNHNPGRRLCMHVLPSALVHSFPLRPGCSEPHCAAAAAGCNASLTVTHNNHLHEILELCCMPTREMMRVAWRRASGLWIPHAKACDEHTDDEVNRLNSTYRARIGQKGQQPHCRSWLPLRSVGRELLRAASHGTPGLRKTR